MTLSIRRTGAPARLHLWDGDEWIGEIVSEELTDQDIAEGETPLWEVTVWSLMGTGKTWGDCVDTLAEAKERAAEFYEEFSAERRELSKGARNGKTVSVPMGGQRRR